MPREKTQGPNALAGCLLERKNELGLTQREIEARTKDIDAEGKGVANNTIYYLVNGAHRDPSLKTLYLVGRVLGVSLRKQVTALGYDYDAEQSTVPDTRIIRLQRMISAASPDDLNRIERILALMEDERPRVDAYLDGVEASRPKELQTKKK